MNYLDYDYLITTDNIKKNLLLEASLNKSFLSTKIITLNELKNILFGSVKKNALKYVMDYYNVLPGVAQTYLKNQEYIGELHNYLDENNLITYNKVKLENKKILFLDVFVDKYVLDRLNNYDIDINNVDNKKLDVFEFDNLYDELVYIAVSIKRLLKTIDINNIKLVNVSNDIVFLLKQVFSLFSLPLEDLDNNTLISHDEVKTFLDNINKLDLESNLNIIKDKDIKEKIIDLINDYDLSNLDSKDIDILKYLFNKTNCKKKKYKNVVECINYEDILDDDKYYFVIGFNEGIILKNYKDDDYLSDDEKKKIGLFTSYEKNENEKLLLLKKIFSSNNINLSYHLNSFYESGILPSSIVKEYDFNVIKNVSIDNTYSYKYNVIKYASLLDQFYKYNVYDKELLDYYETYKDEGYLSYDNTFSGIDKNKLYKFLNNKLTLSYSSLDNYSKCKFRFYINNILRIDSYQKTFAMMVGDIFHYCLSKMYNDDFDLDKEYDNYLKNLELDSKEKHYAYKLKNDLAFVIDVIKKQEENSLFDKTMTEEKIFVDKSKNIKVTFVGVIDKIKYLDDGNQRIMAIIDYKTGNLETNLNNFNYGFSMQLPVYIYLAKHEFKDVSVAGFYLQRILNNKSVNETDEETLKKLELDGFTNSNLDILSKWDKNYTSSEFIRSLKMTKNGFYAYSKVVSDRDIEKICNITDDVINKSIDNILDARFDIDPKRIDGELLGCKYCAYHDLCYKKEEDIVDLDNNKFMNILEGYDND